MWKTILNNRILIRFTLLLVSISLSFSISAQDVGQLLLKNYRPKSIYKIPVSFITRAAYPTIDIHSHDYMKSETEISQWVRNMDSCGIQKTIILATNSGPSFDSVINKYSKYKDRFEIWCGFDYHDYDKPGFGPAAVKELERCYNLGARGVGELGDKGLGELYSDPVKAYGMHFDDPRMKPLYEKCAELGMPVNIHIADPIWMYEKMDSTNDGLMNALEWQIDLSKPGILGFNELINSFENTIKNNPKTTFIACHYANLNNDLDKLAYLLDTYPNLYVDISARFAEAATIPKYMNAFITKYQDRLLYGTDNQPEISMYRITFRTLESADEHFYETQLFGYHWAMNGFDLSNKVLKKLYYKNAKRILKD